MAQADTSLSGSGGRTATAQADGRMVCSGKEEGVLETSSSHRKGADSMTLENLLEIALQAYPDQFKVTVESIKNGTFDPDTGDTLFTFIMNELVETYDEENPVKEADRALTTAIADIEAVRTALRASGNVKVHCDVTSCPVCGSHDFAKRVNESMDEIWVCSDCPAVLFTFFDSHNLRRLAKELNVSGQGDRS